MGLFLRLEHFLSRSPLKGKRILITGGATLEPIDPIRVITSRASGRTGAELAREAYRRGADIALVHGRSVPYPGVIRGIRVETVEQMIRATLGELKTGYDALISSAAISDFTLDSAGSKIKSDAEVVLKLKPARKLIKEVRAKYPHLPIIGFKAETGVGENELIRRAQKSLAENNLSFVVANDVAKEGMGTESNTVYLVDGMGVKKVSGGKSEIAKAIMDKLEAIL